MTYRLNNVTPKCTTDQCRAMRHITHVEFATREQAEAFIDAHGFTSLQVVAVPDETAPSSDVTSS